MFSYFKIKNLFSFEDLISQELKSYVVCQFTRVGFNYRYIGETTRQLTTWINEHISTEKIQTFFGTSKNHLSVKISTLLHVLKIIESAKSAFTLKVKEALHINKLNPELNFQVHHLKSNFNL